MSEIIVPGDNGQEDEKPEDQKQQQPEDQGCGNCGWWMTMAIRPDKHGWGGCTNKEHELAPYGVVMMGYGYCEGWKERPTPPKIVKAPEGALKQLNHRARRGSPPRPRIMG